MMRWLTTKLHPMWLIAMWCAGVLVGIAASRIDSWMGDGVWLAAGALLAVVAVARPYRASLVIIGVAGVMCGGWRGDIAQAGAYPLRHAAGQQVTVSGVVTEDVTMNNRKQQVIKLGELSSQQQHYPGVLYVTLATARDIRRSDHLTVRGKLGDGFGAFVGTMYTAQVDRHTRTMHEDIGIEARDGFSANVRREIDEPMASLGLGYVVGQKSDLDPQLAASLRVAGLTHVIVASGYNLTILVRFARRLFARRSRYLATVVPIGLVAGFVGVTGMSPSMARAGLVSVLGILAWYVGRVFHPVVLMLVVAAVTALANPFYLWGDIGWWLSFAAFAGVMIIAPVLHGYFFGPNKPGTVRQLVGETISAQLATLPILVATFGAVSVVALAANMMIVPFVPLAMLLVALVGAAAWVAPGVAGLLAMPTQWLLDTMIRVASWWAQFDWSQLELQLPWWGIVLLYVAIAGVVGYMWRAGHVRLAQSSVVE